MSVTEFPEHDALCLRGKAGSANTGCEKCIGIVAARREGYEAGVRYMQELMDRESQTRTESGTEN